VKRGTSRARHNVEFEVPPLALRKSDVVCRVFRDGELFGRLYVSRGAIVWYQKNGKIGRKLSWRRLDAVAEESGRRIRGF
jgi:hypothetical protein